ncbi:hypothetical protein ACFSQZ_02690 [Rubritalea spongiae]|uniref:Secreted protein n=3 Tax=Rubritalea spongiae TaxID=430797 RepID=A0ABW5DZ62_9BACT
MSTLHKKRRIYFIATIIAFCGTSVLFIPSNVEGIYHAGSMIQSLDDSDHYVRVQDGRISIYSIGSEDEGFISGFYSNPKTPLKVTSASDQATNSLSSITYSAIAGIQTKGDENRFLIRTMPWNSINKVIRNIEVDHIYQDQDFIYKDYYDSNYKIKRQEKLPLPNKTLHPTTHRG